MDAFVSRDKLERRNTQDRGVSSSIISLALSSLSCSGECLTHLATNRRVGDAAVPGAGAFVDASIGGAAATGDGDVMMRFLPSFFAVQEMGKGVHVRFAQPSLPPRSNLLLTTRLIQPTEACERALRRIAAFYPDFLGAMVCLNRFGEYGGAGHGWNFSYSVQTSGMSEPTVVQVAPMSTD